MIKLLMISMFSLLCFTNINAQTKPLSADKIVKDAMAEASQSHKNIFIIFHASWCGWCHKMDTAMNDNAVKSFFDKNYLIIHLTVDESPDKKNLENPGAAALRTQYHGDHQGIPYWFIIDKNGKFLADSRVIEESGKQGNSVGCPAEPGEVDYFVRVIKKTSSLNDAQLALIQKRFLKNKN